MAIETTLTSASATATINSSLNAQNFVACGWVYLQTRFTGYNTLLTLDAGSTCYWGSTADGNNWRLRLNAAAYEPGVAWALQTWTFWAIRGSGGTDLTLWLGGLSDKAPTKYTTTGTIGTLSGFTAKLGSGIALGARARYASIRFFASALTDAEVEQEMWSSRPRSDACNWYPLLGNTLSANYVDLIGGSNLSSATEADLLVSDGAPVGWGAPIIVPQYATVVAPVLSLPGVQNITASSATPKVTLTF